jgi:hypothetical protein
MTFTVDIRADIAKIARCMDNMEKKQLPFAVSLTLNKLAVKAQEDICGNVRKVFNNSNRWYDKRQRTGIKVSFADKQQLVASVYTRAHFAFIQEEGGIKKPYSGSNLAVPTGNIPKKQRSSKALRAAQGDRSIFRLGSTIYKRISNQKLQRLYSLTPQAKIKPRFGFKRIAVSSFNKGFDRVFTESFNYAMRTAR